MSVIETLDQIRQRLALDALIKASGQLDAAKEEYQRAIFRASEAGIPNTRLARAIGKSESAVRLYLKRKK